MIRKKLNKKGLSFKFLLAILIVVSLLALLLRFSSMTNDVKEKPFGKTQLGILALASQGDLALISLDAAAFVARNKTEEKFTLRGAVENFFEDDKNPCGLYFNNNYINFLVY